MSPPTNNRWSTLKSRPTSHSPGLSARHDGAPGRFPVPAPGRPARLLAADRADRWPAVLAEPEVPRAAAAQDEEASTTIPAPGDVEVHARAARVRRMAAAEGAGTDAGCSDLQVCRVLDGPAGDSPVVPHEVA